MLSGGGDLFGCRDCCCSPGNVNVIASRVWEQLAAWTYLQFKFWAYTPASMMADTPTQLFAKHYSQFSLCIFNCDDVSCMLESLCTE